MGDPTSLPALTWIALAWQGGDSIDFRKPFRKSFRNPFPKPFPVFLIFSKKLSGFSRNFNSIKFLGQFPTFDLFWLGNGRRIHLSKNVFRSIRHGKMTKKPCFVGHQNGDKAEKRLVFVSNYFWNSNTAAFQNDAWCPNDLVINLFISHMYINNSE